MWYEIEVEKHSYLKTMDSISLIEKDNIEYYVSYDSGSTNKKILIKTKYKMKENGFKPFRLK